MRLLHRLRDDAPGRHLEVTALVREHVLGPRADDHVERLLPHGPRVLRVDAEALELVARRRAAGAELEPAVAHAVEDGGHLGGAHGMVVREGEEPDAVADAESRRLGGDRAVQHLGRGAVGELGEEVVLDRPEVRESHLLAAHRLGDRLMIGVALAARVPRCGDGNLVEEAEVEGGHRALVTEVARA
jgi:hypothetical protein